MPTSDDLIEALGRSSETITQRVWAGSAGVLAFSISFIIEGGGAGAPFLPPEKVVGPAMMAMGALLIDFVQHLSAYAMELGLLRRLEAAGETSAPFNRRAPLYRLRSGCFYGKVVLFMASMGWLIGVAGARLTGLSP